MKRIKPLSHVLELNAIKRKVELLDYNDLLNVLLDYDIVIWPLKVQNLYNLYIVKDFETKFRKYVWASHLTSINVISLFFNLNYGIKIFDLKSLRNILYGFLVHEAYEYVLSFEREVRREVKIINNNLGIIGRADIVTNNYVIEIKSGKKKRGHLYQLLAYMITLNKVKGYIVYPYEVVEVNMNNTLLKDLIKRINKTKHIYQEVLNSDLRSLCLKFPKHKQQFLSNYRIDPLDLMNILRLKGFI